MRYVASRGGHAPGHLRDALLTAALAASSGDPPAWWDVLGDEEVISFGNPEKRDWWDNLDPKQRARWLTGQLWNCSDILPGIVCQEFDLQGKQTYGCLARHLRAELD